MEVSQGGGRGRKRDTRRWRRWGGWQGNVIGGPCYCCRCYSRSFQGEWFVKEEGREMVELWSWGHVYVDFNSSREESACGRRIGGKKVEGVGGKYSGTETSTCMAV